MSLNQRKPFSFDYKAGPTQSTTYGGGYGAPRTAMYTSSAAKTILMRVQQHKAKGKFLGFVYGSLIFVFLLMAASTIMAMYSRAYRHFIHNKITMIVLAVIMVILSVLFMACEQLLKRLQPIFFIVYAFGLALLTGSLVTHFRSMIISYAIFLILFMVIGLAMFAFTTSANFGDHTSYLSVIGIALVGLGSFCLFWREDVQTIIFASIMTILFGIYLVYYTQTISTKYGNGYDDNDYFIACLSIFVSLVQLAVGFLGMSMF